MGGLTGRAISGDEIVERGLKDAIIDRAHDNVPDGDMRDAARLRYRFQMHIPPCPSSRAIPIASSAVGSGFATRTRCRSRGPVRVSAARSRGHAESPSTPLVP